MTTKGARLMMVLAMHVVGDSSSNGDKPGARRDWNKPAARHNQLKDFRQRYARLTA